MFEIEEKSKVAVLLTFAAGKEVTVTTKGDKQTDVHLFIYDGDNKEVGKDTSPGPKCEVKFMPKKGGNVQAPRQERRPGVEQGHAGVKAAERDDKPTDGGKAVGVQEQGV